MANSEWRMVFWRAVLLRCQKISAHQEWFGELNFCLTEKISDRNFGTSGDVPSRLLACFSRLRYRRHRLRVGGQNREGEVLAEPKQQRLASSEWFLWKAVLLRCRKFRSCGNTTLQLTNTKRRMNSALKNFAINHWLKPTAWMVLGNCSGKSDNRADWANGKFPSMD